MQLRADEQAAVLSAIVDVALGAATRSAPKPLTIDVLTRELRSTVLDPSSPSGIALVASGVRPKVITNLDLLLSTVLDREGSDARKREAVSSLAAGLNVASTVARSLLPVAVPESQVGSCIYKLLMLFLRFI